VPPNRSPEGRARSAALDPGGAPGRRYHRPRQGFYQSFGRRAFRRPLTDADNSRYLALFNKGATLLASGDVFVDGVEIVLRALLQSPHFLYRIEGSTAVVNGRIPLTDYEIASRLSFSLANTMPDDALLSAANAKRCRPATPVAAQAQRSDQFSGRSGDGLRLSLSAAAPPRLRPDQQGSAKRHPPSRPR